MNNIQRDTLIDTIRTAAHPLVGAATDYDPFIERIGNARFVLLGEASHGTHEFYHERAKITRRLIEEKGFSAVAVEADWPDAYCINRFVRGLSDDEFAIDALADFKRFPAWMWRNTEVAEFVEWLRAYNDARASDTEKVGFYGLDLYSLHASMDAVLEYLDHVDPAAAKTARARYSCFDHFGDDAQTYGFLAGTGVSRTCENEVVAQLVELQRRASDYLRRDGRAAEDELFFAEQNARLIVNAENYYRSMYLGDVSTWNLRDRHMVDTLGELTRHLERHGGRAKIVLWAHNSHLGDARATQMGRRGELNVGQLVREEHGGDAVLVGFTTDHGTVTAASDWGGPAERKRIRPGLPDSFEGLFNRVEIDRFLLTFGRNSAATRALDGPMLERAIGVIYRPETERFSHYFDARLSKQFDAVLHFNETLAVEPLERTAEWEAGELPETYPFAV
jgi:erythromycin esterase-like protein